MGMVLSMRAMIWLGAIGALVAGVVTSAAVGPVQSAPVRAPDFHLTLLGGGAVSLSTFKGKPLVLLFWAPW